MDYVCPWCDAPWSDKGSGCACLSEYCDSNPCSGWAIRRACQGMHIGMRPLARAEGAQISCVLKRYQHSATYAIHYPRLARRLERGDFESRYKARATRGIDRPKVVCEGHGMSLLAVAVIDRAVRDLPSLYHGLRAEQWLLDDGDHVGSLRWWCDVAMVDAEWVRKKIDSTDLIERGRAARKQKKEKKECLKS